ncbi:MAG: ABC transporter permease [Acidobacteriota bacterium]
MSEPSLQTPSQVGQLLRLAIQDVRLAFRDRASIFWMLMLPIAFMWIFGQMQYQGNGPNPIYLAVDDRDGGWLAQELVRTLESESLEISSLPWSEVALDAGASDAGASDIGAEDPDQPVQQSGGDDEGSSGDGSVEGNPTQSRPADQSTEGQPAGDTTGEPAERAPDQDAPDQDAEPPPPPQVPRVLVIPEGFTAGAVAGEVQTLHLRVRSGASQEYSFAARTHITRAATSVLTRLVEANLELTPEEETGNAASSLVQLLTTLVEPTLGSALSDLGGSAGAGDSESDAEGDERSAEPSEEPSEEQLAALVRTLGERPTLVEVRTSVAGSGQEVPTGFSLSVPGTLALLVLMMTAIYGGVSLAQERERGVLRRLATLPVTRGQLFLGKLLGRFFIALLQVLMLVAVGTLVFQLNWGPSPLGLGLLLGAYAFACAGYSLLLGAVLRTPDQVSSIAWISSMAMAALGGCWWPKEIMPEWMRTLGLAFPTGWAMDGFHALISFGRGLEATVEPAAALVGFGMLFTWLGRRYLRFD